MQQVITKIQQFSILRVYVHRTARSNLLPANGFAGNYYLFTLMARQFMTLLSYLQINFLSFLQLCEFNFHVPNEILISDHLKADVLHLLLFRCNIILFSFQ